MISFQAKEANCFNVCQLDILIENDVLNLVHVVFGIELNGLVLELSFFFFYCGLAVMIKRTKELSNCSNWYELKVYKLC